MSEEKSVQMNESDKEETGEGYESDESRSNDDTSTAVSSDGKAAEETEKKEGITFKDVVDKVSAVCQNQKLRTALCYIIPGIIFLITVCISIYYITVTSKGEFHADCTDTLMWAAASHESGSVFDPKFGYACFLPFGINLIMQPFVGMFGVSLTTHHIGMMGFFILFVTFLALMLRQLKWKWNHIMLGVSAFLAITFSSGKMREIFWGHTIYYTLGLLFILIGCFLYFRMMNLMDRMSEPTNDLNKRNRLKIHYIICLAVLSVFIMFTATDGISALSIFGLPFIAGIFAEQVLNSESKLISKKAIPTYLKAVVFFIMIYLGGKLLEAWQGDLIAGYQDAYSKFSVIDNWTNNLHNLPIAWMRLFGVQSLPQFKLSDPEGITNLICIAMSALVFVVPIIATCFYPKYEKNTRGKAIRIMIWIHWAATAIIFSGFVFGLLSGADWRLIPSVGTSLIVTLMFIHNAIFSKLSAKRVAILLCLPIAYFSYSNLKTVYDMDSDNYKQNLLFLLTDCLKENDLTYGYATFWNANSITVISGSEVKCCDINLNESDISPRLYQASSEWYKDQEGQEKYFLLLNDSEYATVQAYPASPISQADYEIDPVVNGIPFHILVFSGNLF